MTTQCTTPTTKNLAELCLGVGDYEPAPAPSPRSACIHSVVGVSLQVADEDLRIHRHALTRRQGLLIELAGEELELNEAIPRGDATFASTALAITLLDPLQFSECGRDFLKKYTTVKAWIGQQGIKAIWERINASEYVEYGIWRLKRHQTPKGQ